MTPRHPVRAIRAHHSGTRLLWLLAAAGCNQVLGVEPLPGSSEPERIWPAKDAACESCVDSMCAEETEACSASIECRNAYACLRSAETPIDPGDMFRCRIGDWGTPARALLSCVETCSACGLGEDTSCVGRWDYPSVITGKTLTVEIALADEDKDPVVGAQVRACFSDNPGCRPIEGKTAISDAGGVVQIEGVSEGFDGFLEITAADFPTVYWYPQQERLWWETRTPVGMFSLDVLEGIRDAALLRFDLGALVASMGSCYNPLQTSLPVSYSLAPDATDILEGSLAGLTYIANIQPGYYDVTAEVDERDASTRTVQIGAGIITYARLLPSERP
jgi:hypothetical protein